MGSFRIGLWALDISNLYIFWRSSGLVVNSCILIVCYVCQIFWVVLEQANHSGPGAKNLLVVGLAGDENHWQCRLVRF